jgi:hypothetical protein
VKIALCTTTIHVPHALKLMRKCSQDVRFFVAVERDKADGIAEFCYKVDARPVCEGDWKCSESLGWNTIARRNIAFLEALKWGADAIYSHDDDNLPIGIDHFDLIEAATGYPFNGIKVSNTKGWFDPGSLLIPVTRHRGVPWNHSHANWSEPVIDAKIGVAAGLVIGDPDIDATTRMEHHPDIGAVHILGTSGVVVDPNTWTVFNSQNTAVIRELIPAWFMMPGVGRHDDIYASLIVQRVARERGYHVHFGPPFCYQQRNQHNLITDLRAEIDGMENVVKLAELLDSIQLPSGWTVIDDTRRIYEQLADCAFIPEQAVKAALMWLTDCAGVM